MHPFLIFELPDAFVDQYRDRPAFRTALGEATFWRTYSRSDNPRVPEGMMESWADVCRRVIEGMHSIEKSHCLLNKINWNEEKALASSQEAFDLLFNFKWTPPGRGLQFMGTRIVHVDGVVECLQNCAFISTVDIKETGGQAFEWLMNYSMLGVGVGFDVLGAESVYVRGPSHDVVDFQLIPDTREGWADSVRTLVDTYLLGYPTIEFDYSEIRPAGAPIKRFGGFASGPQALIDCHRDIRLVLDRNTGRPLTSTTITDIQNIIGVAVIAGNTRRSAEIALGSPNDVAFTRLKTPKQLEVRPWSYLSNNSVFVGALTDTDPLAALTYENGEPGYFFHNNVVNYARMNKVLDQSDFRAIGANPCMEQELEHREMCTLAEMYMPRIAPEERRSTVKHAYRYAKLVTLLSGNITDPITREVMMRNRRIGLSQTGVAEYYDQHGQTALISVLSEMYDYVRRYDALYSQWYVVPRSIRTTSVKPSGTVSLLAGVTPGAHFAVKGPYYIRRVSMRAGSPLALMLAERGYRVEPSVYAEDTWKVTFPEKLPAGVRTEGSVSMWEQLDLAAILARYWADNMVSITIKFKKEATTVAEVAALIRSASTKLKGVSMLPLDEGLYPEMPYEDITEAEYVALTRNLKPLHLEGNPMGLHETVDAWCDSDGCIIPDYTENR